MKNRMIKFYEFSEHKKAKILFLIYLCSGLWFLTIGENPLTEGGIITDIYLSIGIFNTIVIVPFLIGALPFLPILFKKYGFLSYFLFFYYLFIFLFYLFFTNGGQSIFPSF